MVGVAAAGVGADVAAPRPTPPPMPTTSAALQTSHRTGIASSIAAPVGSRTVAVSSLSASGIRWNLDDLMPDADAARREWDALLTRARDFAERRRGTVGSVAPAEFHTLLSE